MPLLVLFLLIVGTGSAWAGWRFQGQNGTDEIWNRGDNMTQVGSSDIWYYKISNLNADIQFKINNGNWNDNNQKYWSANHDDQNRGNVQLEDANDGDGDGKNRFKYSRNTNFGKNVARDLYIFVKGDANNPSTSDRVWAVATPVGESALSPSTTYKMRGDLFLGSTNNNGWADIDQAFVPTFERLANHVAERITLLVPQPANSQTVQIRLEVKSDNTKSISVDADGSNVTLTQNSTKVLITIPGTGNDDTNVKKLTISHYASHKISAVLSDATTGDDWYVYVDKRNKGQLSQGKLTVSSLGSGNHSIFLAKGNISSDTEISNPNSQGWAQCISWLGGLHINKNGSDVYWADQYQYSDGDRFSSSSVKWPLKGQFDGRGQFNLTSASDVYVRLQNGVITLSTTPPADVTYTGNEFMFLSKYQQHTDGNTFNFTADGAHIFVYFWNSETNANAWSDEAFMWDSGDNVLGAKVPAGTWTNCKVVRKNSNDSGKNWNNVWNQSHDQTIEAGKNYLRTGETDVWAVYTPPFYLTGSEALCGANWGYSGNGTTYNGSATRNNIPAGTYQFKLNPTKDYSSNWAHQINYNHIASTGSNVVLSKEGDNNIQFTLSEASDVTIAYDGNGVTVNAVAAVASAHTVTFDSNGGGAIAGSPVEVEDGEKVTKPADPTRAGYVFQGWILNGSAYDFNSTVTSNITLVAVWGIEYTGNDYYFWKSNISSWGTFLAGKDRTQFLQFKNSYTNQTTHTNLAFLWEQTGSEGDNFIGILAAIAPQGTWDKVRHCRVNADSWNEGAILGTGEGSTDWIDLQPGNYIHKDNGSITFATKTEEHFKFYLAGSVALAGGSGEFNPWNGNGTLHTDAVTKTLNAANDYKFKLNPDMRIYDNRGGVNKWTNEFNWTDVDAANSSNTINLRNGGNNEIWFDLSRKSDVTIACDGHHVTVNAVPYHLVTFKDGESTLSSVEVKNGEKASAPSDPEKANYTFNYWKLEGGSTAFDFVNTTITSDITLVADWTAPTLYTVTFNTGEGGSAIDAAEVLEGNPVSQPSNPNRSGYNFVKWQLNGVDYNFSSAVNGDITLDAVWAAKTLESISLDESSIVMVMGGSNATLTPSYLPTDLIAEQQPTYDWSVSPSGVVTVDGGVITAVGEGTATITCTAHGTDKSAECVVTVKDCNTVPTDIFSYTLGSDPTGDAAGSAVMNGMFDEADNTEPANLTKVRLALGNSNDYKYVYDPNTGVGSQLKYGDNNTDYAYWYRIEAGQTANSIQIYVLKNVGTGKYLAKAEGGGTGNWDWVQAITANTADDNTAKWHLATSSDQRLMNLEKSDGNGSYSTKEYFLHRYNVNSSNTTSNQTVVVGSSDGNQGNGELKFNFRDAAEVANPAYMHSPVDGYYRFTTGANVEVTLNRAIKVNDVIRLEVKNPSDAVVSATVTIGSQVANINLTAGATSTETISVTDASRPTSITIASDDVNFMLKSVAVNREMPNPAKNPNLAWSDTPSAAHQVADGDISSYIATRLGTGLITYTSSNESIATVAADGTVHPIAEGTVTITATLEQDGCYDDDEIHYDITLEDLPKPTITLTVPDAAVPQGSVQTISASQNGDGVFTVSILSGSDATLTENGDGTYTLRLGDNASNIVIEAATTRTLNYAQHAVTETVEVTNCAPDGRIIYSYALTGHGDLNAAEAEGGFYSQANLASVGTDDNPKTVSKVRIGLGNQNSLQYVYDPNTALGNHIDYGSGNTDDYYWYVIPKGMTNSSIQKFALKNASTGYYLAKAAGGGTGNWDWVQAISANSCDANTAQWHWAISYTNNNHPRLMNMDRSNGDGSFNKPEYFLHRNTSANNGVSKVVVGSSDGDQGNGELNAWFTDETNANNPDYFYSVENDDHTYYILNGGTVTVSRVSAFKAGDVITLNVFNRGAAAGNTIKVAENTIATNVNGAAALQYTVAEGDGIQGENNFVITPLDEYICLNSISIFRPKDEDEFINPTLTWDADLSAQQMIDMNNSETGMSHAVSVDAPVNEAVVYSVSPAAKADINSATGALTLTGEAQNKDVLTVTATLPAIGCYNQAVASYEIYVKNLAAPSLSATFGTLQQGYASTLTVTTNSDAVPALSSISGFALNGDPVHEDNTYIFNIVVGSTAEAVSVHVALAVTSDYLAAEMDAADDHVTTSSLAQLYENTPAEGTLVLEADYNEGLVIDKAITIDGAGHSIGNLKVENEGDLTLGSALTVNDFTICAKAGNTEIHAASGQVRNASNLTANGNVYFLYTVDPNGQVQYGWYDFTVPFPVDVMTGIAGIQNEVLNEDFVNERDYAIMEHLGEKQANGEYSYKKFRGIMQPNKLYSITLDDDYNYNTVRFQKTNDGALVAGDEVTLNTYASTVDDKHANWNGVGNGTLHHADAAGGLSVDYVQVYQSGNKTFLTVDRSNYSFVIGSAFMVQQAGSMTLSQATHDELLAPARQESHQLSAISIQIAREDKPFSDQLFITANEDAEPVYTPGVDVAKAGNIGNVNVPQIWTNAYETKLCAHEAQLINGRAKYALSLYAPADGTYTLTGMNIPEGSTLYLTNNGRAIWNLSINDTYSLDLTKGTHSEYGLMIVKLNNAPTEIDAISSQPSGSGKVIRNGILYILHNGKVYTAQGAVMK